MALKAVLVWRNSDSTLDLNSKQGHIIRRSIFAGTLGGGQVTPSAIDSTISIAPFIAQGFDGLVVLSDTATTVTLPTAAPGGVFWVVVYARYRLFEPPLLEFNVVPDSVIQTAVDKEFYIRFAKFTVPVGGVATAALATADFGAGDHSDQLGQSRWRDPVANQAALPLPPAFNGFPPNKNGDVRVTLNDGTPWIWNQGLLVWQVIDSFAVLQAQAARKFALERMEKRSTAGTGLLSGASDNKAFADGTQGGLVLRDGHDILRVSPTGSGYTLRFAPFHALVNGHTIHTRDEVVTLSAPPGIGERYDLVFLEVWRVEIPAPVTAFVWNNNVSGTYTFTEIETIIEQIVAENPVFGASNFNFNGIEFTDNDKLIVTLWAFTVKDNITFTQPVNIGALAIASTVPGAGNYAVTTRNARVGRATTADPTIYKGVAYAMPLAVVKRSTSEGATFVPRVTHNTITLSGVTVFFVAPYTDIATARKLTRVTVKDLADKRYLEQNYPAGVLEGHKTALDWINGGAAGPLEFELPTTRYKLTFPTTTHASATIATANSNTVRLPAPPGALGSVRQLVFLLYWASPNRTITGLSATTAANAFQALQVTHVEADQVGARGLFATGAYYAVDVGTSMTEQEAFAALTFTILDAAVTFVSIANEPGLYKVNTLPPAWIAEHGSDAHIYAMPVALIHRRNSAGYTFGALAANFNGSTVGANLRPEELYGGVSAKPFDLLAREVLDLRHLTGDVDMDALLEETMSRLIGGRLNTGFTRCPISKSVVATNTHLMRDTLGNAVLDFPNMTVAPSSMLDHARHVFSDAQEVQVISWTTEPVVDPVDPGGNFTKEFASDGTIDSIVNANALDVIQQKPLVDESGNPLFTVIYGRAAGLPFTQLQIRAPRGAYIHTGMSTLNPGSFLVGGPGTPVANRHDVGLVNFTHIHCGPITPGPAANPSTNFDRATNLFAGVSRDVRINYDYLRDALGNMNVMVVPALPDTTDTNGRPRMVTLTWNTFDDPGDIAGPVGPTVSSAPACIQVVCAFVYDKPRTANKHANDETYYGPTNGEKVTGLSLPPERIYNINGTIRGVGYANIGVGPLYKTITKNTGGAPASTFIITAADIAAISGETNIRIFGILDQPAIQTAITPHPIVEAVYVEIGIVPTTEIRVDFTSSIPLGTNVVFKVAYTSTQNFYWFEIYKASRGIHGPFTWVADTIRQVADGVSVQNSKTGVEGRWQTFGVAHPLKSPNTFAAGPPGLSLIAPAPTFQMVAQRDSPFGYYTLSSANTNSYAALLATFYDGTHPAPYAVGQAGYSRWNSTVSLNTDPDPSLGWTAMYFDTQGISVRLGIGTQANADGTILIYATAIPLSEADGDQVTITYEGMAYQGLMGDNIALTTRLDRVQEAIVPDQFDSIRYEAVSDLFVTTAGTGMPRIGISDFGTRPFYPTGGTPQAYFRGSFYDPLGAARRGLSVQYRSKALNSERLRPVKPQTFRGAFFDTDDDTLDLVMHFVPAPPSQYGPATIFHTFLLGTAPGQMADYEHNAINPVFQAGTTLAFPGSSKHQQYAIGDQVIRVEHADGRAVRRGFNLVLSGSNAGGPNFEPDAVDSPMAFTNFNDLRYGSGQAFDPAPGYELVRLASDANLALMRTRLVSWALFLPENHGRPFNDGSGAPQGEGTRGFQTARRWMSPEFFFIAPCENLLTLCTLDRAYKDDVTDPDEFFPRGELSPTLLAQSSIPMMHQNLGNIDFPNQGNFLMQPTPQLYKLMLINEPNVSIQKLWAFKGSVVNKEGRCTLLINSGWGSAMLRDFHAGSQDISVVFPNTGYSADVFELLYRPVRRK